MSLFHVFREVVYQCVVCVGHPVVYFLKTLLACRSCCFGGRECVVVKEFKGLPSVVDGFLLGIGPSVQGIPKVDGGLSALWSDASANSAEASSIRVSSSVAVSSASRSEVKPEPSLLRGMDIEPLKPAGLAVLIASMNVAVRSDMSTGASVENPPRCGGNRDNEY